MNGSQTDAKPNSGAFLEREDFGGTQVEVIRETAAAAVAARETAAVQARYIMALKRPRNIEATRQEIIETCKRVDFAKTAWFDLRKQNKGAGFTIRFAEELIRAMGNIYPEGAIVYESDEMRMIRVTVTDLEKNVPYSSEIIVRKVVEKKKLKEGQEAIGKRRNAAGEEVFLVEATDDEVMSRMNNLKSKAIRTDGLRLVPSWLKEECKRQIFATIDGDAKADPDKAKRQMIDDFATLGIKVPDLEAYLGKSLEKVLPHDLVHMRPLYNALVDHEITWDQVMAKVGETGSAAAADRVAEEKLAEIRKETDARKAAAGGSSPSTTVDSSTTQVEGEADPAKTEKGKPRGFNFGGGAKKP